MQETTIVLRVAAECPTCQGTGRVCRMEPKLWGTGENSVRLIGMPALQCEVCPECGGARAAVNDVVCHEEAEVY